MRRVGGMVGHGWPGALHHARPGVAKPAGRMLVRPAVPNRDKQSGAATFLWTQTLCAGLVRLRARVLFSEGRAAFRARRCPARCLVCTFGHAWYASVNTAAERTYSSPKFGERVAGVERSEPPDRRVSGGSLTLDPGHPKPDHPNLELLTYRRAGAADRDAGWLMGGRSSIGRAPALQAGGWRFEPARLHSRRTAFGSRWPRSL